MSVFNYSLVVNGLPCEVKIEYTDVPTGTKKTIDKTASSIVGSPAIIPITPYSSPAEKPQPTQAAWVTAKRVAHLPFH